jgi:nicotinate-nucleotide--dimethylbenzimidazole phosphoribosyltransferase
MMPNWWLNPAAVADADSEAAARARQAVLTKPPGALGQLEALAVRLAGLQRRQRPRLERLSIVIFAADHGVAAEGVSAFPQAVTAEMVRNFARGGAAISVLARELGATLDVVNLGTVTELEPLPGVVDQRLGAGTANFTQAPAMTGPQLDAALNAGAAAADRAVVGGAELFIGGEMGIANTTAATAVACVLLRAAPEVLVGPGTGLDRQGVARKAAVIARGLARHQPDDEPLAALRCLGGFEIAALAGAYLRSAQRGLPALVDGFISTVAALVAVRVQPTAAPWLLLSHRSAEPGHARLLAAFEPELPLLDLGMRLGEGSGAAVAVPLLRLACALHDRMHTFTEAGVPNRDG